MIVTWIAIQSQPLPWVEQRSDVAYVACGEREGELALVRREDRPHVPGLDRLLDSLERAISTERSSLKDAPNLAWLRRAMPDQGTSIRLSAPRQCDATSYDEQVRRLASGLLP